MVEFSSIEIEWLHQARCNLMRFSILSDIRHSMRDWIYINSFSAFTPAKALTKKLLLKLNIDENAYLAPEAYAHICSLLEGL